MSKIVIDARMWGESGVGRYIRNLVFNLEQLDQDNEYFLILLDKDYQVIKLPANFKKVRANFRWYGVSEQVKLPKILKKINPDLVHFPHFNVPILYRGKFVVTIHDLIHQHFQMRRATTRDPFTYRIKSFGYNAVFQNALRRSQKIIVPSIYVKDLLTKEWKVSTEKIVVTPEGVDQKILDEIEKVKDSKIGVLEKFGIKPPYILYVGNAHPHKNVEGLIKAFGELRKQYQYLQLVLAGNNHYFWDRIKKEFTHKDIIYTGHVTDEELVSLYKNAQVFVQPSFEEGFGIPILEAFATSTPVVSSNAGSLPEVGDKAAEYFDPTDQEEMVEKIKEVLNDQKLRAEMIKKGKDRIRDFSWEKLAKQTLEVYRHASSHSS